MWNNGDELLLGHIASMYHQDQQNGLHLLPRLTFDHIKLNSYSIMRVNLAAQVLSKSVAADLKEFGGRNTLATAKYCEMVNDFFDCFNSRSTNERHFQRNNNLPPYTMLRTRGFCG